MLLALALAASLSPGPARAVVLDGRALAVPAAAESFGTALPLDLLLSAEDRALLATLLHRGWTPDDPAAEKAHPETPVRLAGRPPDLDLEHAGARIDERFRLLLWRRPERVRALPLWEGLVLRQAGIRPLQPPTRGPEVAQEALDRALADFSFGLSQTRVVGAQPRLVWVKLAEAPAGAEDLLVDLPAAAALAPAAPAARPAFTLRPLPPPQRVSAEVIARPESPERRVALTFDACSTLDRSFYDDRITRELVARKAPATLFISGRWAETHLRQMRELARDPLFEIANHSYIHPHMTEVPPERQREELLWTQQILLTLTGRVPRFFRPPYGEVDPALAAVAAEGGLRTVEFDFPSGDPDRHVTRERMIAWVLAKARPGSIVVMHMNRRGWHTAEALPAIIDGLRAKGFVLSRVGDLVPERPPAGR